MWLQAILLAPLTTEVVLPKTLVPSKTSILVKTPSFLATVETISNVNGVFSLSKFSKNRPE